MKSKAIPHLYDDENITFGELSNILKLGMLGKLNRFYKLTEKVDGQNLSLTWNDGLVLYVADKIMLSSLQDIEVRYKDVPNILEVFSSVFTYFETLFISIDDSYLNQYFDFGKYYLNLEIVSNKTRNVIYYGFGSSITIFAHNTFYLQDNSRVVVSNKDFLSFLDTLEISLYPIGEDVVIMRPVEVQISEGLAKNNIKAVSFFEKNLSVILNENNLTLNNTLLDYYKERIRKKLTIEIPFLSKQTLDHLVNRWSLKDKGNYRITKSNITENTQLSKIKELDNIMWSYREECKFELKKLVLFSCNRILSCVSFSLCSNSDKAVNLLKNDLEEFISIYKKGGLKSKVVNNNLDLFRFLGGLTYFQPIEGLILFHKEKQYKLCGVFTPINYLLGKLKY